MPCGANTGRRVVRSATGSSNGLWITDDILDNAFSHYLRAHRHQHRRHGSNVPGPMEARKRQSKRRMGMAVSFDQPMGPLIPEWRGMFSMGSLFDKRPIDSRWTWAAPTDRSTGNKSNGLAVQDIPTMTADLSSDVVVCPAVTLDECHSLDDIRTLYWRTCPLGEDAVKFGEAALTRYLELFDETLHSSRVATFGPLTEFLASEMNDANTYNTAFLIRWLARHEDRYSKALERQHVRICNFAREQVTSGSMSFSAIRQLLKALQEYRIIASPIATSNPSKSYSFSKTDALIKAIERRLQSCWGEDGALAAGDELVHYLQSLPRRRRYLVRLLRTVAGMPSNHQWKHAGCVRDALIECMHDERSEEPMSVLMSTMECANAMVTEEARLQAWWIDTAVYTTHSLLILTLDNPENNKYLTQWLEALRLQGQHSHSAPFVTKIWDRVVPLLIRARAGTKPELAEMVPQLHQHQINIEEDALKATRFGHAQTATILIRRHLGSGNIWKAKWVFDRSPSRLSHCEPLLPALVSIGHDNISSYMTMLNRRDTANTVPMESRSHPLNPLTTGRVRMVDALARQVSLSDKISDKRALKLVWALYKYVLDHKAPISSTMTRALVRVGLTRYLSHNAPVLNHRSVRILQLVNQTEGEYIAKLLEMVVVEWARVVEGRLERGEIVQHPLQLSQGVGQDTKLGAGGDVQPTVRSMPVRTRWRRRSVPSVRRGKRVRHVVRFRGFSGTKIATVRVSPTAS